MPASSEPRIAGIEVLRFGAAVSVLLWHFQHFGIGLDPASFVRSEQPFYRLLAPFYLHGAQGVEVFWAISGFIFFFKYFDRMSQGGVGAGDFFIARFSRLYPLNLLTLLLVLGLQLAFLAQHGDYFIYQYNDLRHFVLNLLFISGWGLQQGDSFNSPTWSVSVELIVYVVFFVLITYLSLIRAWIAMLLLVVLTSVAGIAVVGTCMLYFFAGGALALLRFKPDRLPGWGLVPRAVQRHVFPLAAALLLLAAIPASWVGLHHPDNTHLVLLMSMTLSLAAICVVTLLDPWFLRSARIWVFLGNLTYASYLTHFPIQLVLVLALPALGFSLDYRDPALFALFFGLTFVVSVLVYRYIEMPAQSAIRRYCAARKGRGAGRPTTAAGPRV